MTMWLRRVGPGVSAALAIGVVVHVALRGIPWLPDVVGALAVGVAIRAIFPKPWASPGAKLIVRYGLRLAIIALGAGLNLDVIAGRGPATLALILILVTTAMLLGILVGSVARLDRRVAILVGAGTAICGASAIVALSPVVRARDNETAYAITTIFIFNIVALFCLPIIGHSFHMTQFRFGTWDGTAVNDTSVVVATGYIYGPTAGALATLVKLTRTLLLVPLSIVVALGFVEQADSTSIVRGAWKNVPWFVVGFLLLAIANTLHVISPPLTTGIAEVGSLALVVVLAAVGLEVDLRAIKQMGVKPLLVGLVLATTMAAASITLITAFRIQ
jgi:uncharacterized integral membrane protein (TIGR00698 family)